MTESSAKYHLWNRALSRIGEAADITSNTDTQLSATTCAIHHDDLVRLMLESFTYPWARRQATLTCIDTVTETTTGATSPGTTQFDIGSDFRDGSTLTVTKILLTDDSGVTYTTWSSGTTYASGATVVKGSRYYESLQNANTNHDPSTSHTWWTLVKGEMVEDEDYTVTSPTLDGVLGHITTDTAVLDTHQIEIVVAISRVGWEHAYALPSDFVAPVALLFENQRVDLTTADGRYPYDIYSAMDGQDKEFFTDLATDDDFVLEYTGEVRSVSMMPAAFREALVYRLAAELAVALRKDAAIAQGMLKMARDTEAIAQSNALRHRQENPELDSPTLNARG
jgi:hypothetical protein